MKAMRRMLVTGSSGLIGSEVATYFSHQGWDVHGVDNNMRAFFFGPEGDTRWNQRRLEETLPRFTHHELDIRDRQGVLELIETLQPDAIVHAAAQPSHDKAAQIPFEDFDVNAVGTLNLLEATRRYAPEAVFVHMSTNKVYGDAPNELPLVELEKRWDYADPAYYNGIPETFRIDQSKHSIFGASKVAADFLSYLIKCNVTGRKYTIYGYKGKQVRDNIHSYDVARFIECFIEEPRVAEVYNLGGGRGNSCSILEAFEMVEALSGRKMIYDYVDKPREGDHICYISDLTKMKTHYPQWDITKKLPDIFEEIYRGWVERIKAQQAA